MLWILGKCLHDHRLDPARRNWALAGDLEVQSAALAQLGGGRSSAAARVKQAAGDDRVVVAVGTGRRRPGRGVETGDVEEDVG